MKQLVRLALGVLLQGGTTVAHAGPADPTQRSPIVYNLRGDEVGVIQRINPNGDVIMLPTGGVLDLGYYEVKMPTNVLRPRERGGWETTMSNYDIAFLPPVPPRFFMPSGD